MKVAVTVLFLLASTIGAFVLSARLPQPYGRIIRWGFALVILAGAAAWVSEATLGPLPGLAGMASSWLVTGAKWAATAVLAAGFLMMMWLRGTSRYQQLQTGYGPGGRRSAVLGMLLGAGFLGFLIAAWAFVRYYG